ncbi:MAG: DUF302 domain-containing protein [Verrucomicrobia bacterium]|nr:DUF302 domain-containing protein [Verrucomicrobiota bacterium]
MKTTMMVLAVASLLGVSALTGTAQSGDANRVDKLSNKPFSDTLKAVEKTVKSEGMMVVAKIDHKKMLSMVGATIKGATTIEFGKPEMGKMLLPMNPAIGLEMPGKIFVYESADGRVVVSFRKVAPQYASYGDPEVKKAGEMMDMMADKITSAATR